MEKKPLVKRKNLRLQDFEYATPCFYFVTICTKERKNLFWTPEKLPPTQNLSDVGVVGAVSGRPHEGLLNKNGKLVELAILSIPKHYPAYFIDNYVIMPDHIHLLLQILCDDENGRPMTAPTLNRVINHFKGAVSKRLGFSCWQRSFYDHIIRNQADYIKHYNYVETNPLLWDNHSKEFL